MRKILFLTLMTLISTINVAQTMQNKTISLHKDWIFSEIGTNQWIKTDIPSSVQQSLIQNEKLENPFYGTNERKIQWVEDKDWEYRKIFQLSDKELKYDAIFLHFEGLDTFSDVFLNGEKLFYSENMFVEHQINVKNKLKEGENILMIRFYSPVGHLKPLRDASGFEYPAANDHRAEKVSVYSRKAPYHFGWDWGIRIVQMGIWRPISLKLYNKAQIEDFWVQQKAISEQKASIENHIEIESTKNQKGIIEIRYKKDQKWISSKKEIQLNTGKNTFSIAQEIEKPKLWQPKGWGEAFLYPFEAKIYIDNQLIDEKKLQIGLRKIELVREKDSKGESFYFKVNDKPIFAKGANYIPGKTLTTEQDSAYYDQLFENILAANMNMIRVWGGGIYENKKFYELADKNGILVWQDFMFACTPYPHDAKFLENVEKEAIQNVKRLRNYASIALWCGNNEVEESIKYWGFETQVPSHAYEGFKVGYTKLFKELLPKVVKNNDPQKHYVHSSPLSANWGRPESLSVGDSHYWGVWYGREPFEILNTRLSRFMSEFGFQAFPELKTIKTFATEQDFDIESEVMKIHQKSSTGNDAIKEYMARYYHNPKSFEDFVYLGLVMQGEGMKKGILAHRRNRPYCMGSLYWQLNDSWPVVSWAGIDYYNNWKALHYKAREAFLPIAVDVFHNSRNGNTEFYVFSDELKDQNNCTLRIKLIDFEGKIRKEFHKDVKVEANKSMLIKSIPTTIFANEEVQKNTFIKVEIVNSQGKIITKDHFFYHWPLKLNLPNTEIKTSVKHEDGKYTISLKSEKLAKNVFIEIPILGAKFSDNFFDLLPNEEKIIEITAPELSKTSPTNFTIKHLKQTY